MNSIERLVAEHDVILRGLDLLEAAVRRLDAGQDPPREFVLWAPEFFAGFADKCHHAKEEDVFFPRLKERGVPEHGGPLGVMLHEHDVGRLCVRQMREAGSAEEFDRAAFAAAAKKFIPLLRDHIFKENNILFRMAETVMSDADDADVNAQFDQLETQHAYAEVQQQFVDAVVKWETVFSAEGRSEPEASSLEA